MSSIAKRLPIWMAGLLAMMLAVVTQAETISSADLKPLLSGNDERVYFWYEQWCDPNTTQTGQQNQQCSDEGISRHYAGQTVADPDSGDAWVQLFKNDREHLARINANGEQEYFGGYRHKEYRRYSHDWSWRAFGFVTPPTDVTQLSPGTLDSANLTPYVLAPQSLTTGTPFASSFVEAVGRWDRDQWLAPSATFLTAAETQPDFVQDTEVFQETATLVGRVDLTQDINTLITSDPDLAELFAAKPEAQQEFLDWRGSFANNSFLTNVAKVVIEGADAEYDGDALIGSGDFRQVKFIALGIGTVLGFDFATWVDVHNSAVTEQEFEYYFLLSFSVGQQADQSAFVASKDVVVSTTDTNGFDKVSVDLFCGPFSTDTAFEFTNEHYRGSMPAEHCGRSDLILPAATTSVTVPVYYFSDLTDPTMSSDDIVAGARADGFLPEYDQTLYTPSSFAGATISFDMLRGADVGGTITRFDGQPLVDARVEFRPSSVTDGSKAYSLFGFTDAAGAYSTTIEPGIEYKVHVCDASDDWNWICGKVDPSNNVDPTYSNGSLLVTGSASAPTVVDAMFPEVTDPCATSTDPNCGSTTCPPGDTTCGGGTCPTGDSTCGGGIQTDATITGVVMEENAGVFTPVRADIGVHTADWSYSFWTQSDANGNFSVGVLQGQQYLVEVWPAWDYQTGTQLSDFAGGNWIVDPESSLFTTYDVNDPNSVPLFSASAVDANTCYLGVTEQQFCTDMSITGFVPGAIMNVWDHHIQTQVNMDATNLNLAIAVDLGNPVEGRLVDDQGNGIPNAWVGGGMGGSNTDADGYFTINLPSEGGMGTFQVDVWPGWDPVTQTQDNSFVGGVVVGDEVNGFTLHNDWMLAAQFNEDASNWPATDLDGAGANTVTGLLIQTAASVTINGSVSGLGMNEYAWINAWSPDTHFGNGASTDGSGNFSLSVPAPDAGQTVTYELDFWSESAFVTDRVIVVVDSNGVVSVDGDTTQTTVTFAAATGNKISGRVVDPNGNGVAWTWVEFRTPMPQGQPGDATGTAGGANMQYFGASTDKNGYYTATVQPGTYIGAVYSWDNSYRPNFYNGTVDGASSESGATPIDASTTDVNDINFKLSSGSSISGTIEFSPALNTGEYAWVNVYSESTQTWSGREIRGTGATSYTYTVSGLAEATDYRLDVWSDSYMGGNYGGVPGEAASAPVFWDQATKISTLSGNVSGVNMALSTGSTLTLTVTGDFPAGTTIDANLWSDVNYRGAWGMATADQTGTATITIKGVDPSVGNNFRLWISTWQGGYINGYYQGDLSTTPGSLVSWDQATLFDVASDMTIAATLSSGGSISGTITNLPAGVKAWIDTWSESTFSWGGKEIVGTGSPVSFTINGLALARDYRVAIWSEGAPGGYWAGPGITAVTNWNDAGRVDISPPNAEDFTGADMTLAQGNVISGTVTGWTGTNQWGWVDTWSNSTFSWQGAGVGSSDTDYSLMGLKPGSDYRVNLWAEGYTNQEQKNVNISAGDATVDFILSTGGSIQGSISGLDAGQTVWLDAYNESAHGWGYASVTADQSGNATYAIEGLADGQYRVSLWANNTMFFYAAAGTTLMWDQADLALVTGGGDTLGIDFTITGIETFSLSGTVGVSGSTDASARRWVSVWSNNGGWGWAERKGNGAYTITGLPTGNYWVDAYAPDAIGMRLANNPVVDGAGDVTDEAWTTSWDYNDQGQLAITRDTTGLDVSLLSGVTISGTVTDGISPLSYVWVHAQDEASGFGNGAMTNSSGQYTIENIEPNKTYHLNVWTPSGEGNANITVTTDDYTGADIVVTQDVGSIGGTITSGSAPAEGILVYIYADDGAGGYDFVAAAATNSSGVYNIDGLAPDVAYRVDVYDQTALDNLTPSASQTVTATSGGATADFNL